MDVKKVDAGKGYRWFLCGWELFKREPGIWLVMTVIVLAGVIVLGLVPFVGSLAVTLLLPVLAGGFLLAAERSAKGERIQTGMLFQAFQSGELLNPLLILGALELAAQLGLGLIVMLSMGGSMMTSAMMSGNVDPALVVTPGLLLGLLVVATLGVLVTMAFVYAVPLVTLGRVAPMEALKLSFNACWRNVGALLVFGLIYLVLLVIAVIPFGLGLILLLPVSLLALYCSYTDIFTGGA